MKIFELKRAQRSQAFLKPIYCLNMEVDDVVLSDVHVLCVGEATKLTAGPYPVFISRFEIDKYLPDDAAQEESRPVPNVSPSTPCTVSVQLDDDGDLELCRQESSRKEAFTIYHCHATPISDCGLQIWNGALLMADFILGNPELFSKRRVLELGCGVGVCSIALASVGSDVIATDIHTGALTLLSHSLTKNNRFWTGSVSPKILDWCTESLPKGNGDFEWEKEDLDKLVKADVIVATDVVYDMEVLCQLFRTIEQHSSRNKGTRVYISVEQRVNFSLELLSVGSPAYSRFTEWISKVESQGWNARQIDNDQFPESLGCYERTAFMEMWCLQPREA